ncbi:Protein farnesyltransferase subunit beta [Trichinella patagoniensis]|uniref:Protein farnesyltransferase subunit beta n=1 Tax=Trichinella patagoniensis TaxID=990121 RepID=A0A0V0ZS12_9BILA|nr:Protein farnesyltransferase subunit beta [Trichinella patagoniensis]
MHHGDSSSFFRKPTDEFYHFALNYRFNDDNYLTFSSIEQKRTEELVQECFNAFNDEQQVEYTVPQLLREEHAKYLRSGIEQLHSGYASLDASRTWIVYWIVQSLELLQEPLSIETSKKIIAFLKTCQSPTGGFGGGPGQMAHLATTYAAVMALCIVGTEEAYQAIDRPALLSFLNLMKQPDGSFSMHEDGEIDIRGAYCAAAVARITNIYNEKLFDKTAEWMIGCQTYEGGFSASPGCEAHGGYTFCGIAGLALLGREKLCHAPSVKKWLVSRQMQFEGGFNGRTNKLVDGCYSFWQAASFQIVNQFEIATGVIVDVEVQFRQTSVAELHFALLPTSVRRNRDYYHTCYTLSGLSIAQHFDTEEEEPFVVGSSKNLLINLIHINYFIFVYNRAFLRRLYGDATTGSEPAPYS